MHGGERRLSVSLDNWFTENVCTCIAIFTGEPFKESVIDRYDALKDLRAYVFTKRLNAPAKRARQNRFHDFPNFPPDRGKKKENLSKIGKKRGGKRKRSVRFRNEKRETGEEKKYQSERNI